MEYILINIIWLSYLSVKLLCFNFDTKINTPPFRWKTHKKTLQAVFSFTLLLSGFFMLIGSTVITAVFWIVISFLLFADCLYMRYYKNPLTIAVMRYQIKLVKGIRQSVFGVLKRRDFLYLIDIPFFIVLAVIHPYWKTTFEIRVITGFCFLLIGLIWFLIIYRLSNRKPYYWNKKRMARDLGILYYHLNDIHNYLTEKVKKKDALDKKEVDRIKNAFPARNKNEYTSLAKDKNVIIVQMESMQEFLIDLTIMGKEVTPNLNLLMKENIRFDNMYYQTSVGNTSDAELIINNSLYPLLDKPACYECQKNKFFAMGSAFQNKGYSTFAFHGNQASFWNRHLMYPLYGYDKFIDHSMLMNDEFIFPGLSDASFFRQAVDFLEKKGQEGQYLAFLITLSLHHPYDYFDKDTFYVGDLEGTFIGKYLKGAHYVDHCIGLFINDLKKKGMYEDTLLLLYGDHSGIPRQYRKELMSFIGVEDTDFEWVKLQRVAAMMHLPGRKQSPRISKTVGQIDILPTIANLTDIRIPYALGRDMLDPNYIGGVITRDRIVITDQYISFPNRESVFEIETGKEKIITEDIALEIKRWKDELELSDIILEKNILGIL